jgi:hypothetical protein
MRAAGRILYALDEPLVVLPLDKTDTRSAESCVVLRAAALKRELWQHVTTLDLHHRVLSPALCVGTLTNFQSLYRAHRAHVPYSGSRREVAKLLQRYRLCFLHGSELESLKSHGKPKWRVSSIYHFDASLRRGEFMLRIGVGRGRIFSIDTTPYYSRELLVKKTYQFLEGSLDEETRSRGA